MDEELVQRLREEVIQWCANCVYKSEESHICHAPEEPSCDIRDRLQAADAIEERDRYALTLQHEMMAEAESHIALVERLNKQIEELQKNVAYWQAQLTKSMCGEILAELERPRWIPVAEALPEEKRASYLCLTEGGYCHEVRWTNIHGIVETDKWGWSIFDIPQFSHVTHWMPLPPSPEPPKEEA